MALIPLRVSFDGRIKMRNDRPKISLATKTKKKSSRLRKQLLPELMDDISITQCQISSIFLIGLFVNCEKSNGRISNLIDLDDYFFHRNFRLN